MNIYGAFLLLGPDIEPQVVAITDKAKRDLDARLEIASKHEKDSIRHDAYKIAFGVRAHYAIPCWSVEAMTQLATEYTGEHREKVRGLAACIATGTPYGGPDPGESASDDEGGQRAPIDPVKPKPTKPRGGNKVQPEKPLTAEQLLFGNTRRARRERSGEREAMRIEAMQR